MSHSFRGRNAARFAVLVCSLGAVGCVARRPMALNAKQTLSLEGKSVAIFTLRTTNQLAPIYRPKVLLMDIISADSKKLQRFKPGKPFNKSKHEYEYLVSVDLEPGTYRIGRVRGESVLFPLIAGTFVFPMNLQFELEPKSLAYIGHIDMTNRKRLKGEPRSGPVIPLVDQAATGYAGGTFDIALSDRYDADVADFARTYPVLLNHAVTNRASQTTHCDGK